MRIDNNLAFMLQFENVAWYEEGIVRILDRRIYPREVSFVNCSTHVEVAEAIRDMVTQSAGPFTACGMGMALAAYECRDLDSGSRLEYLENAATTLQNARPTTVSRMKQVTDGCLKIVRENIFEKELDRIIFEYTLSSMENRYSTIGKVAKYLVDMFVDNGKVITQCFGETIIGMMLRECQERNLSIEFFCPETRPFLQGARFTASVISDMGYPVSVITDNMVAVTMVEKHIDLFTSAADSICMDGSIVNKVGTYQMAIVAKYMKIPYFVTGIPDVNVLSSKDLKIENRDPFEVLSCHGIKHTKEDVVGLYPAFDITPAHLVSGVVTDVGIFSPYDLNRYLEFVKGGFYNFAV